MKDDAITIELAKDILWELSYTEKEPCRNIQILREVALKQAREKRNMSFTPLIS